MRVWDIFFVEGLKTIFRIGLALMLNEKDDLLALGFEELTYRIKSMPNNMRSEKHENKKDDKDDHSVIEAIIKSAIKMKVSALLDESATAYEAKEKKR